MYDAITEGFLLRIGTMAMRNVEGWLLCILYASEVML
jgi:hypothetical protein